MKALPYEPLGRVGDQGIKLIEMLSAEAASYRADRTEAPTLRRKWRFALEVTLLKGTADAVARTAGARGMSAWERTAIPRIGWVRPRAPARTQPS